MRSKDLDLSKFREPLEESLRRYISLDRELAFEDFPDLCLTPDKPNSARTVIPVTYAGTKVGEMYAIVFLHQDATGDQNTYQLNEIVIPPEFRHKEKPERVIPRAKTGVIAEGFFPLFSMNQRGYVAPFAAHLDELTLDEENRIVPVFQLGQNRSEYLQAINSGLEIVPKIGLTTGTDKSGRRFGDPHAIYYAMDAYDSVQVVGFLSVKDQANPLMRILNNCPLPKKYV